MTALCGGGTSSPNPGVAEVVVLGGGAIAALLERRGVFWASLLGNVIGNVSYDALNFCATDPPAEPTFTPDDALAILQLTDLDAFGAAVAKVRDLVLNRAWYEFCHCDSTTTPTAPITPAPIGWPDLSQLYNPGNGAPCRNIDTGAQLITGHVTGSVLWFTDDVIVSGHHLVPIPAAATHIRVTGQAIAGTNEDHHAIMPWTTWNAGLTATGQPNDFRTLRPTPTLSGEVNSFDTGPVAITGARDYFECYAYLYPLQSGEDYSIQCTIQFYCNNATGTGLAPCGPDPVTIGLLTQLLQLVTLIQRQAVPFAYVEGTSHTGLTGQGSIAVQGLIGARISVTSVGPQASAIDADPDMLRGVGWVNWGSSDGVTPREFLVATDNLSFPVAAGAMTALHYSLPLGVTVDITELEREP